jgi:dephospho-CoA kinase
VGAEIARRLARARSEGARVVVLDIPLLFEGRKQGREGTLEFDATVVVWAPEQAQIDRQIARDGCSREEALRRVRAQLPLHEKRELADFVIDNSGTPEETERQVRALWEKLSGGRERAAAP